MKEKRKNKISRNLELEPGKDEIQRTDTTNNHKVLDSLNQGLEKNLQLWSPRLNSGSLVKNKYTGCGETERLFHENSCCIRPRESCVPRQHHCWPSSLPTLWGLLWHYNSGWHQSILHPFYYIYCKSMTVNLVQNNTGNCLDGPRQEKYLLVSFLEFSWSTDVGHYIRVCNWIVALISLCKVNCLSGHLLLMVFYLLCCFIICIFGTNLP